MLVSLCAVLSTFATVALQSDQAKAASSRDAPAWPDDLRIDGTVVVASDEGLRPSLEVLCDAVEESGGRWGALVFGEVDDTVLGMVVEFGGEVLGGIGSSRLGDEELAGLFVLSPSAGEVTSAFDAQRELLQRCRAILAEGGVVGAVGAAGEALGAHWLDEAGEAHAGLGLVPDALIDAGGGSAEQMRAAQDALAGVVAVRLEEGAGFVLRGRRARAVGAGGFWLELAESDHFPRRLEPYEPGGGRPPVADWTAWRRDARERTRDDFPAFDPPEPVVPSGTLFLVGGGGVPDEVLTRMVELAGGAESSFVYVPCTEAEEVTREPGFVRTLRDAGAGSATWIHTKDRTKADGDEEILGKLHEATGLWFGGGRQWNFVDSWHDTEAHQLMRDVLARGGVIGGSSAGASIQASYLARGDPLGNLNIIAPGYERGLGFLEGVAVDQHFAERDRFADMTELMEAHPQLLGIGIDESTALIVQGSVGEVCGRGNVHFYDWRAGKPDGDKDHVSLASGERYELRERRVLGR